MIRDIPLSQQSTVNLGVKGLDSPIQHFRKSGKIRYRPDRNLLLVQELGCPTRGDDLILHNLQFFGKLRDSCLV